MRKLATVVLAAMAAVGIAMPARADNVTVQFGLSAGTYVPTGGACEVSVAKDADGVAVLDAAVANRCIVSYHKQQFGSMGYYIDCIDEVCGDSASGMYVTYWAMYEDGVAPQDHGVSGFRSAEGKELTFAFTSWAPCLAPTGCLP